MKVAKVSERRSFLLVEGQDFGSAEFYGKWLLAAAEAEKFWKDLQTAPDFEEEYEPILFAHMLDFGKAASLMLMKLRECNSLLIDQGELEGWDFTIMLMMGFFKKCGSHYGMAIPTGLTKEKVKNAVLALVKTDDDVCMLHPEYFADPMPLAEAQAVQSSLNRAMGRC